MQPQTESKGLKTRRGNGARFSSSLSPKKGRGLHPRYGAADQEKEFFLIQPFTALGHSLDRMRAKHTREGTPL